MTREFVELPEFMKCWKKLGLTDADLQELEKQLCLHPDSGDIVEDTGGLRKLRIEIGNRGKSAGARVLYVDFAYYEKIYLFTAYPKNEKDNLTQEEKNSAKKVIKLILEQLERKVKK